MDSTRLKNFDVNVNYIDGSAIGGVVSSYKPPRPAYFRKVVRTISGYSQFQDNICSDCIIELTLAFQIKGDTPEETQANALKYLEFVSRYSERFIFTNEFGILYKGYFQDKFEPDTPIEGDIYYISTQMLCNHSVTGWVSDSSGV